MAKFFRGSITLTQPESFDKGLTNTLTHLRILSNTSKDMDIEQHIDLKEVLAILKFGKNHFYKLIREGQMPQPVKIGRRSFWYASEIKQSFSQIAMKPNDNAIQAKNP